ncbi:hypothetical protein Pen01_04130 [Phytomonospora endophytica]|nr:hypothetical protein Pen01_04130 [Phytomonospora endophytica]
MAGRGRPAGHEPDRSPSEPLKPGRQLRQAEAVADGAPVGVDDGRAYLVVAQQTGHLFDLGRVVHLHTYCADLVEDRARPGDDETAGRRALDDREAPAFPR